MSAADDIVVLTEYAEWREERAMGGAEDRLSVAVFVKEREDAANARRIEDALARLDRYIIQTRASDGTATVEEALEFAVGLFDMLIDDRDVIEDRSLGDARVRRTFL